MINRYLRTKYFSIEMIPSSEAEWEQLKNVPSKGNLQNPMKTIGIEEELLLDQGYKPAILAWDNWKRECSSCPQPLSAKLNLSRNEHSITFWEIPLKTPTDNHIQENVAILKKIIKSLLWSRGGNKISLDCPEEIFETLKSHYQSDSLAQFDAEMMGNKIYLSPFEIKMGLEASTNLESSAPIGKNLDGCRIGFDLGASDRKVAAVIDGEVVFSEETLWNPVEQSDPNWHFNEIMDSLNKAAEKLPRVDAIGGSSAGVYVDNEVRVASLFRSVPKELFNSEVRPLFKKIQKAWNGIPFQIINDGAVTALAGSMALEQNGVLGIAMGSSMACGYVDKAGNINPWLDELAFCPMDWNENAHVDEWSKAPGCGVQYFSQQAVGRLLKPAGIDLPESLGLPGKLVEVQKLMTGSDKRAAEIYRTIGTYLGYSIPYYREFYEFDYLLILGRVMTGEGGDIILNTARNILDRHFQDISTSLKFHIPGEREKRHGQAIAAASLPKLQ